MGEVAVGHLKGAAFFVVMADVAHEFAREIVDRSKDAAGNDVALDLGEPEFDLIEPRGIGRSEMQAHLGMIGHSMTMR